MLYRYRSSLLNGCPGNVTLAVKRVILRATNAGLDVTATTNGTHAPTSYHYPRPPRNLGMAVDLGVTRPGVTAQQAWDRKVAFQRQLAANPTYFWEVYGPDNAANVKNGRVVQLVEGTPLENQHDTHVHVAPGRPLPVLPIPQKVLDARLAARLWREHKVRYGLRIIKTARATGVPLALALALVEKESGFSNVYGHDPVPNPAPKGGKVTRRNYQGVYLPARKAGKGMQGVGPCQLTWWQFQDEADHRGGCWNPTHNLHVGFEILRRNIKAHGLRDGIAAYNGAGDAALAYATSVLALRDKWAKRL